MPFAVILGAEELKAGDVRVKEQKWEIAGGRKVKIQAEEGDIGALVKREGLLEWIKGSATFKDWVAGK